MQTSLQLIALIVEASIPEEPDEGKLHVGICTGGVR